MDMRINGMIKAYDNFSVSKESAKKDENIKAAKSNGNVLSVSSEGKDYHAIRQALANTPDIREDKVASIKARMENGTYNVSSADVAKKILEGVSLFEA